MLIKELMTSNVVSVTPDTTIVEADGIMKDSNLYCLPVTDDGKVIGMITRDRTRNRVLRALKPMGVYEFLSQLAQMKVKDVMSRNIGIVSPDTSAEEAMILAQNYGTQGFAVMKDGKLVGIASMVNFLKCLVEDFGFDVRSGHLCLFVSCGMEALPEVLRLINESGSQILSLFHTDFSDDKRICTILLNIDGAEQIMNLLGVMKQQVEDEVREPVSV